MFIGKYYHSLEENGRVSLPKEFRDQEKDWIITRGLDGGLFLFRALTYQNELKKLSERSFTTKAHRDFIRFMANEAKQITADLNGRVLLPDYLIKYAKLTKQLVVVGSYQWIEIWDRKEYHSYLETLENQATQLAEKLNYD